MLVSCRILVSIRPGFNQTGVQPIFEVQHSMFMGPENQMKYTLYRAQTWDSKCFAYSFNPSVNNINFIKIPEKNVIEISLNTVNLSTIIEIFFVLHAFRHFFALF